MRWTLPTIQTLTGGYADTSGFLALKGLFTSHVTGNFVTLGSALVFGSSGALAKAMALPVFCGAVLVSRLFALRLKARGQPALRRLLEVQLLLLIVAAALASWLGPFGDPDAGPGLLLGMVLVAAMAMQNAAHRAHLAHTPPSTIMTGTTTQVMLDLGDMVHGLRPEVAAATRARFKRMIWSVVAFAAGCALAALLYAALDKWCFWALPALGLAALTMRSEIADADSRHL